MVDDGYSQPVLDPGAARMAFKRNRVFGIPLAGLTLGLLG
jgi:hypothetical protein